MRGLGARDLNPGYGVVIGIRAFSFADLKAAEATALRLAREQRPAEEAIEVEAVDDEDLSPEIKDDVQGRVVHNLVLLLLLRFGTGWQGVVAAPSDTVDAPEEDEVTAPFDRASLTQFLAQFPGVASALHAEMLSPWAEVIAEGKGSAPLPGTGTPAG